MGQIAGKATITWGGKKLAAENGAKLNPGGDNRKAERHGGNTYWQAEEVAPDLECTLMLDSDADIIGINDATNVTVTFVSDSGQKFLCRGGATSEPCVFDTGTGKAPMKAFFNSITPM